VNLEPKYRASDSPEDIAATARAEAYMNRQYLDPAILGSYPAELREVFGEAWPEWPAADFDLIRQKLDFIGVNYYTRNVTRADANSWPLRAGMVKQPRATYTDVGWEVYPQGLTELLLRLHRDYPVPPLYVTENGGAFKDKLCEGRVHDADRIDYLATHIQAVGQALAAGVPVVGYMVWSLMDNFEWSSGYAKRFGIVHVDYATLARTPKDSALWYRDLVAQCRALRQAEA